MVIGVVVGRSRPGDAAWEYENYERLWEGLSEEFMLRRRFDNLHYKIDLTMHSAKCARRTGRAGPPVERGGRSHAAPMQVFH